MVRLTTLLIATALIGSGQSYGDLFSVIRLIRRPSAYSAGNPQIISAYRNARVPANVIGLRSITGVQQSWLVEAHGSFASVEATDSALATVGGPGQQTEPDFATLIGVLRPALSYRPADAIKS